MNAVLCVMENDPELFYPILKKGFVLLLLRGDSQEKTKKKD
jgi:hypothetical protein